MVRFEIPEGWSAQAYRFALDPTPAQEAALCSHAGARDFAFNTMLAAVKANLDQRAAEKTYGLDGDDLTTAPRFFPSTQLCSRCGAKTKLRLRDRIYHCRTGCPPICRDLNAAINLARLGDPHRATGTGTGSRPAASATAGDGRGATQKTSPITSSDAVGTAGGDEASTPHTAGTAAPQGAAA